MVSRDDEHIICPPSALIAVAMSASDIDRVVLNAILSMKWLTPALVGVSYRAPASM